MRAFFAKVIFRILLHQVYMQKNNPFYIEYHLNRSTKKYFKTLLYIKNTQSQKAFQTAQFIIFLNFQSLLRFPIKELMPKLIQLETFLSDKGSLTVLEKILPEGIKRIFYIYNVENQVRGGHRHKLTYNALVCVSGSCKVYNHDGEKEEIFDLDSPEKCLLVEPRDWHTMYDFSKNTVLLVLSNRFYEKEDYIYEKYPKIGV